MANQDDANDRNEFALAFSGPAMAANRFFVTVGPGGIRIAFLEQGSAEVLPEFRCAAMLPIQDGIELKNLLERLLRSLEAQTPHSAADIDAKNA